MYVDERSTQCFSTCYNAISTGRAFGKQQTTALYTIVFGRVHSRSLGVDLVV